MSLVGRHVEIRGVVQGVGFRPWVYQLAHRSGVTGTVRNDSTGVIIDAYGPRADVDRFTGLLTRDLPPAARVREMSSREIAYVPMDAFTIVPSEASESRNVSIPPDLATCPDCLAEIFDPTNRRYLYPFTNCTNCGPRFTIVRGVPYDREKTTMAAFPMCAECSREYEDPLDRRFHAQPNACWTCGPKVSVLRPDGAPITTNSPIGFAARTLRAQMIVAVKGLGGFHLACDARSSTAVARLRERKHRDAKPLAVMVRDVAAAEELAELTDAERDLLVSVERPIVLVKRRPGAGLAEGIAGRNPLVGLFLPYTPLHHLLLAECEVPIVMTSGNLSDEPMAYENGEALARLGSIADVFLVHDREIETRADDSVVRVIAGAPTFMRRSRGYVPRGVPVPRPFGEPVLALGAHLKNAICIGDRSTAFLGPHVGDLESLETLRSFEAAIEQLKAFVGVVPRVVAHDLHPDYVSTRHALGMPGVQTVAVQHHHAHVVSAMAEHGLIADDSSQVIGVAYDGTGYGTDGTSWGGEILLASCSSFERIATFRPIALAGGDQAIRQVWRIALALLDDAFDGKPPLELIPLFSHRPDLPIASVRSMIATGVNAPLARGVGRYFDAIGAIVLGEPVSRYEGEIAFLWNMAADEHEHGWYRASVRRDVTPWEIDLRLLVKEVILDMLDGRAVSAIAARFHNTIARVTVDVAAEAAAAHGVPIVLSGGCFNNALLAERIIAGLGGSHRVYMNHDIPPGDGGIALGQALIADAIVRAGVTTAAQRPEVSLCV